MRKRVLNITSCIVAFLAIFVAVAMRKPQFGPDVSLVSSVPPFSYQTVQVNDGPLLIERVYVLRMNYKDAVKQVAKELDRHSWQRFYSLADASFMFTKNERETVLIKRCLRLPGMWEPKGQVVTYPGETLVDHPTPDPRGWIVVTTTHPLKGLTPLIARLRFRIGIPLQGGPMHHTDLSPIPAEPMHHSLDVPDVETDECVVTWDAT